MSDESVLPEPSVTAALRPRCLVVEPEAALQKNYGAALVSAGFEVLASHRLQDVLADEQLFDAAAPSVLLIAIDDYVEYHEPRLQQLHKQLLLLRRRWPSSSLIVLADGTPTDWLHALAVDDLLPKVASLATISARCVAASERCKARLPNAEQVWQLLASRVDAQPDAGLLRFNHYRVRVTLSEYEVLAYLSKADGVARSYAELSRVLAYPADPLSIMALIEAAKRRFSEALSEVCDVQHLPHYGYRLSFLGQNSDQPAGAQEQAVDDYGLIDAKPKEVPEA